MPNPTKNAGGPDSSEARPHCEFCGGPVSAGGQGGRHCPRCGTVAGVPPRPLAELVSPAALEAAIKSMSKKLEQIRIFAESAGDTITADDAIRMILALYPPRTPVAGVPIQAPSPGRFDSAELSPPRRRRR